MSFSDQIQWPRAVQARKKLGTVPACQAQKHEWLTLSVHSTNGFKPLYVVCETCGQTPADHVAELVEIERDREAAEAKRDAAEARRTKAKDELVTVTA